MDILTNLSLFSGVGGLDLSAKWTGKIKTICYVENDQYCQAALMSRIREGKLDDAPIWDDIRSFSSLPWIGKVDIISGGFPCQDISSAGKREGLQGKRSGLWGEMQRIIKAVNPSFILIENVSRLSLYWKEIKTALNDLGYQAEPWSNTACATGAPHPRSRMFIISYSRSNFRRLEQEYGSKGSQKISSFNGKARPLARWPYWKEGKIESRICRTIDGIPYWLDRLRCCGNGVVPQQALPAWEKIIEMAELRKNAE